MYSKLWVCGVQLSWPVHEVQRKRLQEQASSNGTYSQEEGWAGQSQDVEVKLQQTWCCKALVAMTICTAPCDFTTVCCDLKLILVRLTTLWCLRFMWLCCCSASATEKVLISWWLDLALLCMLVLWWCMALQGASKVWQSAQITHWALVACNMTNL